MKKWYFLLLIFTLGAGWFAYPHVYPKLLAFAETGELPWAGWEIRKGETAEDSQPEAAVADGAVPSGSPINTVSAAKTLLPEVNAPTFEPIEDLVGDWKAIPARVFPRRVKLTEPVTYSIAGGSGTLPAGSEVIALSADNTANLTVTPNENSSLKGKAPIDHTNFKEVLTAVYEKFKERKLAEFEAAQAEMAAEEAERAALAAEEARRNADPQPGMATGANTPMPAKPVNLDPETKAIIGEPPLQFVDGKVPVMLDSMKSGQVTEIKPDMISYWGRMHFETIEGQPYWVVRVDYTANSIFGIFPTQAKALIRKGKVQRWIYAGSEEPVP